MELTLTIIGWVTLICSYQYSLLTLVKYLANKNKNVIFIIVAIIGTLLYVLIYLLLVQSLTIVLKNV